MKNGSADGKPSLVTSDVGADALGMTNEGGIVFGSGQRGQDLYVAELDLATGTIAREATRPLGGFMTAAMQPTWSADGTALAYLSPRSRSGRNAVLGILDSISGRVRELQPALERFFLPRWQPDGTAVVVQGLTLDAKQGLFSIDVNSGVVTVLVLAGEAEQLAAPQLSPDGKHLYFGRVGKDYRKVIQRDRATGAERELKAPPGIVNLQLSPDGAQLAMMVRDAAANRATVMVMSSSGGEAREVYSPLPGTNLTNYLTWSSDGRHLLALKSPSTPSLDRESILVSLNGDPPRTLGLPRNVAGPVVMHPDGRRVAYTTAETRSEVWILENFLPSAKSARR